MNQTRGLGLEDEDSFEDPNFDQDGKALWGVPGAGAYETVTSIGKTAVFHNAPDYTFGVLHKKKPFVSKQHDINDYGGCDSPGPMYLPSTVALSSSKREPDYSFGTADRSAGRLQYISQEHCKENAAAYTPGPGTYKRKEGKGIAKSLGDAPTFRFGTGPQRVFPGNRDSVHVPGPGANNLPAVDSGAPAYTFAPHGSMELGHQRHRDQQDSLFISQAHAMTDMSLADYPAPGHYHIGSTMGAKNSSYYMDAAMTARGHPGYSFGAAKKYGDQNLHVFISKQHMSPDPASPGPIYDTVDPMGKGMPGLNFGHQRRFYEHSGQRSPGPAQYNTAHYSSNSKLVPPGEPVTIGTSKRPEVTSSTTWVPGPGAYVPKMAAETSGARGMFRNPPGYSVASNIRSEVAPGADPDEPGPGFYQVNGKEIQDVVRTRAATTKFGKDTNRSTFMNVQPYPGPGTYDQGIPKSQKDSPKVAFGQLDRTKNPKARFCTKLYISSLHTADQLSCGTPGPGAYQHHTGKGVARSIGDGASCKMGTGKRDNRKLFISRQHSNVEGPGDSGEIPGPGHYQPDVEKTSKFRSPGGSSFGKSKRPGLATVKF